MGKLRCVLVDNDLSAHQTVRDLCSHTELAEVTRSYDNSKTFLKEQNKLEYDVCMLDIGLPELDGLVVAQLLNGKPVIFVTGQETRLREAIDFGPVDILFKPFRKERLYNAL